ncbi:MAG: hypothetical protein DMG11_28250 [Acidobacteria bacterium]|nr:MAG: hypothetical protein DMG11_28250 [Acidobacteriota bacterium]
MPRRVPAGALARACTVLKVIWSKAEQGRFPEIKELKQLVRDRVAPGKSLARMAGKHRFDLRRIIWSAAFRQETLQ